MSTFTVNAVSKAWSSDGTHRHIETVFTIGGQEYTRSQVVDSIAAGNTWQTSQGGYSAKIRAVHYCPARGCLATPYIQTNPDSSLADNLENLPERRR